MNSKWIRSAFWIGKPKQGSENEFIRAMNDDIVPAFQLVPGVNRVMALWPMRREDGPPEIYCQFLVEFSSEADLERMLVSPERLALRPRVRELAAIFDGAISHIDFKAG